MAKMTVEELQANLKDPSYTARTDEELQAAAEKRFQSQYNQQKLTAQQSYETSDLAYQNQLKALQDTLATNQNTLLKNTIDSMTAADRYTITRGMQRSSYGAANRANIQNKGNESMAALLKQYATDAGGIESNRTLLAQQLASTLAQYDIDYLNDVQAYIDEQKQIDYERQAAATEAANALQMQLFEYSRQYGSSGGSSRKKSSGGGGTPPSTPPANDLYTALAGTNLAGESSETRKIANAITILTGNNKNADSYKKEVSGGVKG